LPYLRDFGPEYPPLAIGAGSEPITGALLSLDRLTLWVAFLGGHPYDPADWCSHDYRPWVAIDGDVLEVAIGVARHPEQATAPPNSGCILDGREYLFRLALPTAFTGTTVRDASTALGELWVPDPARVAELGRLPSGWVLVDVHTGRASDPAPHALARTWTPVPGDPSDPNAAIFLTQTVGGAPDDVSSPVVATIDIGGRSVDVLDWGGGGLGAVWQLGDDWLTLVAYLTNLDVESFGTMVGGIAVPSS